MTIVRYAESPLHSDERREIWSETGAKIFASWYISNHPKGVVLVYCADNVLVYLGRTWPKKDMKQIIHPTLVTPRSKIQ